MNASKRKSKLDKAIEDFKHLRQRIIVMQKLGASKGEIAKALGIPENSPAFEQL